MSEFEAQPGASPSRSRPHICLSGTLRIFLQDNGQVEFHHAVDKGYTEAYTDSEEERYRTGPLGDQEATESDYCKVKGWNWATSMDSSLCNCTVADIEEGTGIGCEDSTTHSSIAWICIVRSCHRHPAHLECPRFQPMWFGSILSVE